jgi:hypothetical protein
VDLAVYNHLITTIHPLARAATRERHWLGSLS